MSGEESTRPNLAPVRARAPVGTVGLRTELLSDLGRTALVRGGPDCLW